MKLTREEIITELTVGMPDECQKDYAEVITALRDGSAASDILAMPEVNAWPETYVWLKANL